MLRKEPVPLLDQAQCERVVTLVQRLIDVLKSSRIAVDERHTPMLYSRFLSGLLSKHKPKQEQSTPSTSSSASLSSSDALELPRHKPTRAHKSSPSIEIVPPQPERQDQDMHQQQHYEHVDHVDYTTYDTHPHPLSDPYGQVQYDPHQLQDTSAMMGQLPTGQHSVYGGSATNTETVHGYGTVTGSQYGFPMGMEDDMLVPMMAIDNPNFWENGLMPGFSWPSNDIPWDNMEN